MVTTARLLTYDDYAAMPDDGKRNELIGGELFEMPSPSERHQEQLARLFIVVRMFVATHRHGKVYFAPFDTRLSPHGVVRPNLLFVSRVRADAFGPHYLEGGPDLACVVLSPSTRSRDLGVKMQLYAAAGVPEL